MKLTYRGVSYDYTPNPVPPKAPSFATGVYRGQAIAFQALAELPEQPVADLMWRGVPYQTGHAPEVSTVAPAPVSVPQATATAPANGVVARARQLFIQHHQRSRKREQGMMVRLAVEVGIPVDDAAHYASRIQGELPHNFGSYDRSSSAMS